MQFIPSEIIIWTVQSYVRVVRIKQICAAVVILQQRNLLNYHLPDKLPRASLKGLYAVLLILTREQPLSAINALPINLLTLAECSNS